MRSRILLAVGLFATLLAADALAQQASIEVSVTKSPGGKGRVLSYNASAGKLTVALRAPGGRTNRVEVSRNHVSPKAWRAITKILSQAPDNAEQLDTAPADEATGAASSDSSVTNQADAPIEVSARYVPRSKGTLVSYNADHDAVVVDFDGKRGREIPVNQLDAASWAKAKKELAQRIIREKQPDEPE